MSRIFYRSSGIVLCWAAISITLLMLKQDGISTMSFLDSDDVMRMLQVRAWLDGQAWSDLNNYRVTPGGANIHWSRIVDLPLAGAQMLFQPWLGRSAAEQASAVLIPLITLLAAMLAIGHVTRRISNAPMALASVMTALIITSLVIFSPLRVDHHAWQNTLFACALLGLVDIKPIRGGIILGMASALSVGIGLELAPYLALLWGALAVRWAINDQNSTRLIASGTALAIATMATGLFFISGSNASARCDALSAVWLPVIITGGFTCAVLPLLGAKSRNERRAALIIFGGLLGVYFAFAFPHCLGAPEGISEKARTLWFNKVGEAAAIGGGSWTIIIALLISPVAGLFGAVKARQRATNPDQRFAWQLLSMLTFGGIALMIWQNRFGYVLPVIAAPGIAVLLTDIFKALRNKFSNSHQNSAQAISLAGVIIAAAIITGMPILIIGSTIEKQLGAPSGIFTNNHSCQSIHTYEHLNRLPTGIVVSLPDNAPRILYATEAAQHQVLTVAYHREADRIVEAYEAFGGNDQQLSSYAKRHNAAYVVVCQSSEAAMLANQPRPSAIRSILGGKTPTGLKKIPSANAGLAIFKVEY